MRIKQPLVLLAMILLLIASISVAFPNNAVAIEKDKVGNYDKKDEVIYGNLTANGKVQNMYVVNTFHVSKQGSMIDYGKYDHVRNLTNLLPIEQQDGKKIQFQADENEFYYQGELQNEPLPWDIDITYLLNGERASPDKLAGESGKLEIHLSTSANKEVDATFFDYYLLQVSVTLDPEVFNNVQAPKGTEAKEGKNRLISFNVMPGEEEELVVSANVEDFEMEPIQISAIPANIAIDDPEFDNMKDDIQSLTDAIRDIDKGIGEMKDGISELKDGAKELNEGSGEYLSGIQQLDQSSGSLIDGSKQIQGALNQINQAIGEEDIDFPTEEEIKQLTDGLREVAGALQQSSKGLEELNEIISNIPNDELDLSILDGISEDAEVNETIQSLIEIYNITEQIKGVNEQLIKPFIESTNEFAEALLLIADEIEENMSELGELENLIEGLSQLSSQYQTFHHGLVDYTNGVNQLSKSYIEIDRGTKGIANGTNELEKGARELHEGSTELREETKDLPDEMQSEIDEQLVSFDYSDFEAISFVSEKNKHIGVVQFVLQTEKIEKPDDEVEVDETKEEKGFWQRFLDLFRKK